MRGRRIRTFDIKRTNKLYFIRVTYWALMHVLHLAIPTRHQKELQEIAKSKRAWHTIIEGLCFTNVNRERRKGDGTYSEKNIREYSCILPSRVILISIQMEWSFIVCEVNGHSWLSADGGWRSTKKECGSFAVTSSITKDTMAVAKTMDDLAEDGRPPTFAFLVISLSMLREV